MTVKIVLTVGKRPLFPAMWPVWKWKCLFVPTTWHLALPRARDPIEASLYTFGELALEATFSHFYTLLLPWVNPTLFVKGITVEHLGATKVPIHSRRK